MRHAELARQRLALGVEVDPDDFVGAHHLGALDDVKADAAQAENHDIGAGLDLGGENNRPHPGGYAAPHVANLVERGNVTDFRHGDFGYDDMRSEDHTSELHSLMRNTSAVFCLK